MYSSNSNNVPTQQNSPSAERPRSTRFEDNFQQLMTCEIAPLTWISVNKSKSIDSTFVDIRKKREKMVNGVKMFIPTKSGLFLRLEEYEKLKDRLVCITEGEQRKFEFTVAPGRTVSGHLRVDGCWHFSIKTEVKESVLTLTGSEISKIAAYSIPNSVFAAMGEIIWG